MARQVMGLRREPTAILQSFCTFPHWPQKFHHRIKTRAEHSFNWSWTKEKKKETNCMGRGGEMVEINLGRVREDDEYDRSGIT